jgi:hypothetical protein
MAVKVKVETFECEETKNEHVEVSDEAIRLIDQLGLGGQQKLIRRADSNGEQKARSPYRRMTDDEKTVYEFLCPEKTTLEKFEAESIPLRVLQVAAHAHSLGMFTRLEVWSRKAAEVKDPVLVGVVQDATYHWQLNYFILARWGEELEEWPALVAQTLRRWKEEAKQALFGIVAQAKADVETIDTATLKAVAGGMPRYNFGR